ncbi:MAG: long-chain fatty acid--CoA ligase [Gammaproteobacteria bacterium]|nr:MAG: long-chain fatty acid--CoA ligase [Gammaproteobacteria bacterium]
MEAVRKSWDHYGIPHDLPPSEMHNLLDLLAEAVRNYGNQPAVTSLGGTLTYTELDRQSSAFASYLQRYTGLERGDRIAIQMPSLIQYLVVAYGAFKAGMVIVNVNPMYTATELEYQFNHADVKAVVVFDKFLDHTLAVKDKTPLQTVISTSPFDLHPPLKRVVMSALMKLLGKAVSTAGSISLLEALKKGSEQPHQEVALGGDDLAILQYTGGTTGVSKPAMLSHSNMVNVTRQSAMVLESCGVDRGAERFVSPLPLYHIYAFAVVITVGVHLGVHTLLIPDPRNIKGFVKLLRQWPASVFIGLNTLFVALMKDPDFGSIDFSSLKFTISGGSALATGTSNDWFDKTGCRISEAYGLTEASPVVSLTPSPGGKQGAVGIALPGTEIKIADEDGNPLAVDDHGELWVRGPQVMQGYLHFQEETAKTVTADGWLKTGDIASVDEDGFLRIHDRMKDMIIVSGFNVYPNEIEGVVSRHPDVTYCAAVGVPDEHSGEAVKLYVVSSNPGLTEKDIRDFCAEQLARYKLPKYIEFRDELPLSNVGKVLRRELRDN